MRYQRADAAGGMDFFTVKLTEQCLDFLVQHIEELCTVMQRVKQAHPFAALWWVAPNLSAGWDGGGYRER